MFLIKFNKNYKTHILYIDKVQKFGYNRKYTILRNC